MPNNRNPTSRPKPLTPRQRQQLYRMFTPERARSALLRELIDESHAQAVVKIELLRYRLDLELDQLRDMGVRACLTVAAPLAAHSGNEIGRALMQWWLT